MKITKALAMVAVASFGLASLTTTAAGCKKNDDTEETDDDDESSPEEEPTAEPSATASAQEGANEAGDVETYPEMTKAGGTYRLLRRFYVYHGADETSKKLTGLAPGTLVDFKHYYRDWIMIDWPSGPGQLSPGWIHLRRTQINVNTKKEERPDAGKTEVPDAGKTEEVPDAGKTEAKPDAGSGHRRLRPGFHFKIPKKK